MKTTFFIALILSFLGLAFFSAQQKIASPTDVHSLKLGMTSSDIEELFGYPSAIDHNRIIYIFNDSSELIITMRSGLVSSAQLKFHRPLKIEDPEMRQLTLVQMESDLENANQPSWFFAGKPEEGLVYKITASGTIESLTWVPPFTYGSNQPKQLKAILRDFRSQHWSKI